MTYLYIYICTDIGLFIGTFLTKYIVTRNFRWDLEYYKAVADDAEEELSIQRERFHCSKALVEEREVNGEYPYFAVYFRVGTRKFDIRRVGYDRHDPSDREYRRIFAEELAEKLNERP